MLRFGLCYVSLARGKMISTNSYPSRISAARARKPASRNSGREHRKELSELMWSDARKNEESLPSVARQGLYGGCVPTRRVVLSLSPRVDRVPALRFET